jgi:FMN phosphatase YigB (HAD superfamily)
MKRKAIMNIFDAAYTSDVLHVAKPEAAFFSWRSFGGKD